MHTYTHVHTQTHTHTRTDPAWLALYHYTVVMSEIVIK